MTEKPVPRHIFWRRQYDERRYARHLSQAELNKRIRDVFLNLLRVNPEAKIGLHPINDESAVWIEKWTHVLEEMQLRHGPYPAGFSRDILYSEPFPDFASDLAEKAAKTLLSYGLRKNEVFIKYGKRKYMEPFYQAGSLRIQPASFFSERDLNGAAKDDELMLPLSFALSRKDILKLVVNPQDVPGDAPEQRVDVHFRSPTDYWLYCVTRSVEPRLFVDFNADACVIIRDKDVFRQMLHQAASRALPRATMSEGPAIYVDPLLPHTTKIFVPLAKHFGYSYQEEYRFCWIPPQAAKKLAHIDVEIGSLDQIAEIIVL